MISGKQSNEPMPLDLPVTSIPQASGNSALSINETIRFSSPVMDSEGNYEASPNRFQLLVDYFDFMKCRTPKTQHDDMDTALAKLLEDGFDIIVMQKLTPKDWMEYNIRRGLALRLQDNVNAFYKYRHSFR